MITKKIFIFLLLLTLGSCGYEPIYSKKNDLNILIKDIQLEGDKKLNRKIISLINLKKNKKGYTLLLKSNKILKVTSKDKAGNPSTYKTTINASLSLSEENKIIKQKNFSANFNYNNMENKFNLSQYQKNIESNLINTITEQIFIFLNS